MKKLLLIFCFFFSVSLCFGQNGWSFECGGYSFKVWDDDTPIEYSFRSGDKIERNYSGDVVKVGDIRISYNYSGEVDQIGNVRISRNYSGEIDKIGGMRLEFNYSGEFTGSSGSIGCNW
jgi:hypothetical protein